jgi:glycosyltransferase involved in cell wall biosynthesis
MTPATAVLLSYKRRENIPRIVRTLFAQRFIREVVLWDNDRDAPGTSEFHKSLRRRWGRRLRIATSPTNKFTWARFLAAEYAKHNLIVTCDDDCIVHNWQAIYETARANQDRIVHCLKPQHLHHHLKLQQDGLPYNALLGWGSAFRRELLDAFRPYLDRYGEDEMLLRKADHIFGLLQPHRAVCMPADIEDFPNATGDMALFRREDHKPLTKLAVQRCEELRENPPDRKIAVRIIVDQHGWCYETRAKSLMKRCPPDFRMSLGYQEQPNCGLGNGLHDIVFDINYGHVAQTQKTMRQLKSPAKLVSSFNTGYPRRLDYLNRCLTLSHTTIINNRDCWERTGRPTRSVWLSNGVETDTFRVITPPAERSPRVLWCGSTVSRELKGYDSILLPLKERLEAAGIPCDFRLTDPHDEPNLLNQQQMAEWYNTGTIFVCASEVEGTPNVCLEAAACGCVIVTTRVGNMPEFITNGEGLIVERSVDALERGVRQAVNFYSVMWPKSVATIQREWDWDVRAPLFFDAFRNIARA